MRKLEIEASLLKLLQASPGKVTTKTISEKLGVSISTASKYLEAMKREGKVSERKEGPSKFWSPGSDKVIHSDGHISLRGRRLVMMPVEAASALLSREGANSLGKSIASMSEGTVKERVEQILGLLSMKGWGHHSLQDFDSSTFTANIVSKSVPTDSFPSVLAGAYSHVIGRQCVAEEKKIQGGSLFKLAPQAQI